MVRLQHDRNGNFIARKRLPDDVRDEYGGRHGARHEAKFSVRARVGASAAKQRFREWDAEVTARIDAIRAERKGEGIALTRQQARALAGEWYQWFIARHSTSDLGKWDAVRDQVHDALHEEVGDAEWVRSNPDELWREDAKLRRAVKPVRLRDIRIEGEPVEGLDYSQTNPLLAYHIVEAKPPAGDAYALPGLEEYREGVKKVFNAMLFKHPVKNFPKGSRKLNLFPRRVKCEDVTEAILKRDPINPCADHKYPGVGEQGVQLLIPCRNPNSARLRNRCTKQRDALFQPCGRLA